LIELALSFMRALTALLFERVRYRPAVTPDGPWQETAERFVDPTTAQLMKVSYNPQTGARDYLPVSPTPEPPLQNGRDKR